MYADLPRELQRQVFKYLRANDFVAAKTLHDTWHSRQEQPDI